MKNEFYDFVSKFQQPSLRPQVERYVNWRRDLGRKRASGESDPPPPVITPTSVNLDLTTACNFRCDHCIDFDVLNSRHRHRLDELKASVRLMASNGLRSVILIGGGEPTLFPNFADFIEFLKSLSLQVAIVTNGSRGDRILGAAPALKTGDWIRLSLDSGSNRLFQAMHKPVNKNVTLDGICEWVPKFKKENSKPKVGFSFVIVWSGAQRDSTAIHENIDEIVAATKRARRYEFDYISFKPFLYRRPSGAEVMDPHAADEVCANLLDRIRTALDEAKSLETDSFKIHESINLRVLMDGSWKNMSLQPRVCHMQAFRQVLTPEGLYNCPAHRGLEKARISSRTAYLDTNSLKETVASTARMQDNFNASKECRDVTCLYNEVNWWLESVIEGSSALVPRVGSSKQQDFFL